MIKDSCFFLLRNLGLYIEPILEFNHQTKDEIILGDKIKFFKCRFCKLEFDDEKMFDNFGFTEKLKQNKSTLIDSEIIEEKLEHEKNEIIENNEKIT